MLQLRTRERKKGKKELPSSHGHTDFKAVVVHPAEREREREREKRSPHARFLARKDVPQFTTAFCV
jgi:hypothetical protein